MLEVAKLSRFVSEITTTTTNRFTGVLQESGGGDADADADAEPNP